MSVLITGGAGFIGGHLTRRLVDDRAADVTIIDNFSRGQRANLDLFRNQIRLIEGDICDRHLLNRLMPGVDVIFHLAARSSVMDAVRNPQSAFATNVDGTYKLLECARRHNVSRVVFASSREVYGEASYLPVPETAELRPKNAYGASKVAAEGYCRRYSGSGVQVAILRLTNVYGPGDHGRVIPCFIESALRGEALTLFGGDQLLDFVWIETVVGALIRAAERPWRGGAMNIGSGRGCSLRALSQRIKDCAKSQSPVVPGAPRAAEVVRFVSDISLAVKHLDLTRPEDPLAHLPSLVMAVRSNALQAGVEV